ncbi:MAG TPA: S8 family serine peptidase [Thermoanaerobaculia bacterium]
MIILQALLMLLRAFEPAAAARADARIFAGKGSGERASFLLVLREQADVSGAARIENRIERRRFVYESLRAQAQVTQAPLLERLAREGIRFRSHYLVNMIEVEADRGLAAELAGRSDVSRLAANLPAPLALPAPFETEIMAAAAALEALPVASAEPNIERVRAPELWSRGFTGEGMVVGIADTGFEWDHPALKSHYRGWNGSGVSHDHNWHDAVHDAASGNSCGSDAPAPCDDDSHGTAISGLAVGGDGDGNRIGVAPGARFIGCRNMDHGNGTPARYTECFEWLLAPTDSIGDDPRPDLAADVINNSWSCPPIEGCTDPNVLETVVENVRAAGIAIVVAAGNGGNQCFRISEAPSIYEASLTIGATDLDDHIAGFSSLGPVTIDGSDRLKPDLVAPGVTVRSSTLGGGYIPNFSGTSAAAPHVSGAIALLWSAVPQLAGRVDDTEEILELSAAPRTLAVNCGDYSGTTVPNPVFGWGRLDVEAAYERAVRPAPILPAPRAGTRVVPPRS